MANNFKSLKNICYTNRGMPMMPGKWTFKNKEDERKVAWWNLKDWIPKYFTVKGENGKTKR